MKKIKFTHPDQISIFCSFQKIFRNQQEYRLKADAELVSVLSREILLDTDTAADIKSQIGKATYMYPRIHPCMQFLVEDAARADKEKDRLRRFKVLAKSYLDSYIFKATVYKPLKGNVRPKFLHIGLKLWQMIADTTAKNETS